jgi:hypothetical protein
MATEAERLGIRLVVEEVGSEQAAEEQDLGREEQPEAELC